MIHYNSTFQEVYRAMLDEREKTEYALHKNEEKMWKMFMRGKSRTLSHHETYRIPASNNTYLLWYYVEEDVFGHATLFGGTVLLNQTRDGYPIYYVCKRFSNVMPGQVYKSDVLLVYTGHFFSRYRERAEVPANKNTYDLITLYLARNLRMMVPLDNDTMMNRADEYPDRIVWQVKDGIVFSTTTEQGKDTRNPFTVSVQNTFVTESMLKGRQKNGTLPSIIMNLFSKYKHEILQECRLLQSIQETDRR